MVKELLNQIINEKSNVPINKKSDKENALETRFNRLIISINKHDPFGLNNNKNNQNKLLNNYVRINVHQNVIDSHKNIQKNKNELLGILVFRCNWTRLI